MKLTQKDYQFNNPRICHLWPRFVELDPLLVNLYMVLKFNGRRPVTRPGRGKVTIPYIVDQLIQQHGEKLVGFKDYQDIIADWVYSDLVDMVFRGNPDKEAVAAPLPLHLNAYKLRNPEHIKDSRAAEHLYSLIQAADADLVRRLSDYLGQGMDYAAGYEKYDELTPLDLDTLMIVRMVANPQLQERPSGEGSYLEPPLCLGQARLFCNDLRRLIAYEHWVPRAVMIGYLRTAIGLHLAQYMLRHFRQLAGWVRDGAAHPACLNCPVDPESPRPFTGCPYAFQNPQADSAQALPALLVDLGDDHTSHMANLAMENCAEIYAVMNNYIQSVFTVNQLFRYAETQAYRRRHPNPPNKVADVLPLLAEPSLEMDAHFDNLILSLIASEGQEEERPEVEAILKMEELSNLEKFVELVSLVKAANYRKRLTEQIDSLSMKNTDTGLLRQGKGKTNRRRWFLGSRLLEFFVQIAVLEGSSSREKARFHSRPILIDEFVRWLEERYGLAILPRWADPTIEDNRAANANLQHLKRRLREIGFFTDLSDAYNTQTIHPRYAIEME